MTSAGPEGSQRRTQEPEIPRCWRTVATVWQRLRLVSERSAGRTMSVGGEAGIRTLGSGFCKQLTAWDFWQQVLAHLSIAVVWSSTRVLSRPPDSASVLATFWQRRAPASFSVKGLAPECSPSRDGAQATRPHVTVSSRAVSSAPGTRRQRHP